jgi:hypothetical protein
MTENAEDIERLGVSIAVLVGSPVTLTITLAPTPPHTVTFTLTLTPSSR